MTDPIEEKVLQTFGGTLRIRVCGICLKNEDILLVGHKGMKGTDLFWAPPGGGMEFGHSTAQNLKREFLEETGLEIKVEKYLFSHEYLAPPLHAIELFFMVTPIGGKLHQGTDPELSNNNQIISKLEYLNWDTINKMKEKEKHQIFSLLQTMDDLRQYQGTFMDHKGELM